MSQAGFQALFFLGVLLLPKIYRICMVYFASHCSGHTASMCDLGWVYTVAVGEPWDVQGPHWERNICYPACSGTEDPGEMKSAGQVPRMVHEALREDQGPCCTRGKVSSTRKQTARETSPHRTYGAVHDTDKTREGCLQWPWKLPCMPVVEHWELDSARGATKGPL